MKPMGQFTFAPAERERPTDETLVMFKEAREGMTPAIQYWYFPNEKVGKEFIYPKEQAQKIAARTGQTVRSDEGPIQAATAGANPAPPAIPPAPADSPRPVASQADASPVVAQPAADASTRAKSSASTDRGIVDTTPEAPVETTARAEIAPRFPEPRPVGTSGIAEAQQPASQNQAAGNERLPDTAGPVPVSALLGLMALASAAGLRALRR
jgi:hypothetical protein